MIIMEPGASESDVAAVIAEVRKYGLRTDIVRNAVGTVVNVIGDQSGVPFSAFTRLAGVRQAERIEKPYRLINREYARECGEPGRRVIRIGDVQIGGDEPVFIAGPCAVESRRQLFEIADAVKMAGAHVLRGGIFKPRSSVHSFQGVGSGGRDQAEEALSWLRDAGDAFGMPVITEVRGESQVDLVAEYVDILQIGTRNMYDQDLLAAVGRKKKPVLFKRHFGAGIEEFLSFAEYIAAEGNRDIMLCERGILPLGKGRSYTRYTLDLASIPVLQQESFLPVVVDPSHATGRRDLIRSISLAAVAAGADALMIETHTDPELSLVDAAQTVNPEELKDIIEDCRRVRRFETVAV